MAVSVRMDPLLEKQLERAAKRQGITKSQFIIDAVERSLGRKNPYELMLALKAEEEQRAYGSNANPAEAAVAQAFEGYEQPMTPTHRARSWWPNCKINMAFAAIVDASAMVALFGRDQPSAAHYNQLFARAAQEQWSLTSTWPCITEASYLLGLPQRYAFLRWVAADGLSIFPFDQSNLEGMAELMRRYTESPRSEMDFGDASLVYLASDTGVNRIMTLDVRDFSRYRLADGRAFEIL